MKTKLYLLLAIICLGCGQTAEEVIQAEEGNPNAVHVVSVSSRPLSSGCVQILTIDSCEYVWCINWNAGAGGLTHKGNCKFCKQRK